MKPLNRILITLICFFASQAAKAEIVTLRNLGGVEIRAEILSATDKTVTLKRSEDGRIFTIGIKSLDEESIALIDEWKVADLKKPKKLMSFTIGNKVKTAKVTLLVPDGEYNTSVVSNNQIWIKFDTGSLELTIYTGRDKVKKSKAAKEAAREASKKVVLKMMEEGRENFLANLTPTQRKKFEPLTELVPMKCGEFDGFRAPNRNGYYGQFLDGNSRVSVRFGAKKGSPITEEIVPAIIATIKIEEN